MKKSIFTGIGTLVIILFLTITSCDTSQPQSYHAKGKIDYPIAQADEIMLDSIQQKTFLFFLHEHHPEWGIVKDRIKDWAPASIASTGFGLPCFAIGAERGWITREEAAVITLKPLEIFMNSAQNDAKDATGYKGFYYHFLKMDDGKREWN